jgi:MFS transporter, SP family, solute carrier family 2 (myo-inositol transporter), member 13
VISDAARLPIGVYNRLLLVIAGLGGLLYGIDVGIIQGALPYLSATSGFSPGQLSFVVAAVLLGSVISTLFAGALADALGRKRLMIATALMFCISVPMIALSHGFWALVFGRLLQGMSGGLIGVVVPLYLAECLSANDRGKGTGMFQWMLVFGFVISSLITLYFSHQLAQLSAATAAQIYAFKDHAWRDTFWISLPFGLLFVAGSFVLAESPRWLFRRARKDAAREALLRSRDPGQAAVELREMEETAETERAQSTAGQRIKESLLRRKYVIPFVIACVILTCNQLTGINSIIPYNTTILLQAGLNDYWAHFGSLLFSFVNFGLTLVAVILVDRKGRRFLLTMGTGGIIVSLLGTGILFHQTEARHVDVGPAVQRLVAGDQTLTLQFDRTAASRLLRSAGVTAHGPQSLVISYAYGDFGSVTNAVRSDEVAAPVRVARDVPNNRIEALLAGSSSPFGDLAAARSAPLRIISAYVTPVPSAANGWLVALTLYAFMGFYAVGPGVVVWLALSELMPTRIRSNGMSIALVLNQATSTTIAAIFLPTVARHGYASMFFAFAAFTIVYFVTAAFFLPETKGKTLEEIEEHFEQTGEGAVATSLPRG